MESMADYLQVTQRDTIRLLFFELEYALSSEVELGIPTSSLARVVNEWASVLYDKGHIDNGEMVSAKKISYEAFALLSV